MSAGPVLLPSTHSAQAVLRYSGYGRGACLIELAPLTTPVSQVTYNLIPYPSVYTCSFFLVCIIDNPSNMNDIISSEEEHELLLDTNSPADQEEAHVFHNGANDESYNEGAHSDPYIDEETEDSPYSEVRAAARNFDEDLPCNTIRAWTIGLTLVVLGAALNTLYSLRAPRIGLGSLMAQILAWLLGLGWESAMPRLEFALFGRTWESNPG
jgi:hypothetical protein